MPNSNKRVLYTVFSVISIILALAFGACAAFCTASFYEPDIAFFLRDAALPKIMLYAVAALSAVYVIFGYAMNKGNSEERYDRPRLTGVTLYSGLLAGFSLIAADVLFLLDLYKGGKAIMFASPSDVITAVMLALAVPAALYFFSISFGASERSAGSTVLGIFVALWAAALLLRLYFNMDLSLNSPTRILGQMVPIAIMCYFVQELRYRIGQARPALFHAFSAVAVLLIAVSAAIEITAAVKYGTADTNRAFKLAELCIGIYILLSTFHLPSAVNEEAGSGRRALKERRLIREADDDSYLDGLADNDLTLGDAQVRDDEGETDDGSADAEHTETENGDCRDADEYGATGEYSRANTPGMTGDEQITDHGEAFGFFDELREDEQKDEIQFGSLTHAQQKETVTPEPYIASAPEFETENAEQPIADKTRAAEKPAEAKPAADNVQTASVTEAEENARRADIKKGLSVSAARRAESFISRMLEEDAQLEAEDDEFDTSCSMDETADDESAD